MDLAFQRFPGLGMNSSMKQSTQRFYTVASLIADSQ